MKASALAATLVICALGFGAIGAASAMSHKPGGDKPSLKGDSYTCFDADMIRGYQSVDEHKLIVTSDFNQAYELSLGGACIGLDTSFTIGIRSRMGSSEICGPFDADVVYNDMGGLRQTQACPVTGVRHLTGDEAAPYVVTKKAGKARP